MFPLKHLRFGYANIRSPYVYIFSLKPLDFGDANSLKALVNKGTLYPFKL